VVALSPRIPDERLGAMARRMADTMATSPWLRTELWEASGFAGGRVHLALANPESQPQTSASGLRAWFDGRIYPPNGLDGVTPTGDTIAAFVRDPRNDLAATDGVFHLACFDPQRRSLAVATDRLGFRPLYWTATPDWFAYAGEVGALLAIREAQPLLDERALRQFFAFDYLLGERTWWEGIELLPPASMWQVSASGVDRCRYWRFAEIRREPRPDAEILEELDRLWSRAIRQRTEAGTTPVLLSGGLDSRLVLSELVRQRVDVSAVTFGERGCPDVSIAQRCAAAAHVSHRVVIMNHGNWWEGRDAAIRRTDGLVNAIHLHVAVAVDALATGNRHSLKNSTGDVLFGGSGFRLFPTQAFALAGTRDWSRAREEFLTTKYAPNPFFSADETAEASRTDCDPYLEGPSTDCFVIHQGQRRWTLTGALSMSGHCEVVNPAASLAVLTLMLGSLPDSARAHSRLYRRFLATRHPDLFRNIPWQKTGRRLDESRAVRLYYRFGDAIRRRLGHYRYPRPFFDYGRAVGACRMRGKLAEGNLLVDDVLHGAARRTLRSDTSVSAQTLLALVTLESYLRQTSGRSTLSLV
jgi:asparagine synthase (glutamine-hydrolysing)